MEKNSEKFWGDQVPVPVLNQHHAERRHDALNNFIEKSSDAAISSGQLALRTITLINGGAVIAVLGFISAIVSKDPTRIEQIMLIANSLLWFSGGVAGSALAAGFAYLTNNATTSSASQQLKVWNHPYVEHTAESKKWMRFAIAFQWCAVVMAMLSICFFIIGAVSVKDAISYIK
jgi:hypothetical protein